MANTTDTKILTTAGKALLAQVNAEESPFKVDKLIFANIPDRADFPQPEDGVPTDYVVAEKAVERRGRLGPNVVIYSSTLTSAEGPYEFNWTGAYSTEKGVLIAIDHHKQTPKTENRPGIAGNTLVRSLSLEYKDIAEITNITVDATTWQYDSTKRLAKMDNDSAQAIIDQNGKDWFIDDGFLVTPQSGSFKVHAGAGYVSGNRVSMEYDSFIQVLEKPAFIYLDAWREGTPTGEWETKYNLFASADEHDDRLDEATTPATPHFVCKIAQVMADGTVRDLRPEGESRNWTRKFDQFESQVSTGYQQLRGDAKSLEGQIVDGHTSIYVYGNDRNDDKQYVISPQRDGEIERVDLIESKLKYVGGEFSYLHPLPRTKSLTGESAGLVYKDESAAERNFSLICMYANLGGYTIHIEDDIHYKATKTAIKKGVNLYYTQGKKAIWTGSEAFAAADGFSHWIERGCTHVSASRLKYFQYDEKDNFIPFLGFYNPEFQGDIYFEFESNLNLNPADPATKPFGFGDVIFDNLKATGNRKNFFTADSLPYKTIKFLSPIVRDFTSSFIGLPIQNSHPYARNIQDAMRILTVSDAHVSQPIDHFGDDVDFTVYYHTFVLWEGHTINYLRNNVDGLITKTGVSCYPVYFGGRVVNTEKCKHKNIFAFNTKGTSAGFNTGVKVKQAKEIYLDDWKHNFSDQFFNYMKSKHNLDADSSECDWITYAPTNWPDGAEIIDINNLRCDMPHLIQTPSNYPKRRVVDFAVTNSRLTTRGDGQTSICRLEWSDDNPYINRQIRLKNNEIIAPGCDLGDLISLTISNNRPGMVINSSGNVISAKSITELRIAETQGSPIKDMIVDSLTLENKVHCSGDYSKFSVQTRYPAFVSLFVGGEVHTGDFLSTKGSGFGCPVIPTGSGALTGRYKQTYRSGSPVMILHSFILPNASYISSKYFLYAGKIKDINVVNEFWFAVRVKSYTDTTITIAYIRPDGVEEELTWDGGVGTSKPMKTNSNHPELKAQILRTGDDLRIQLELGDGRAEIEFDASII